jgi:Zn-dependent protease with chaperone function
MSEILNLALMLLILVIFVYVFSFIGKAVSRDFEDKDGSSFFLGLIVTIVVCYALIFLIKIFK